MKLIGPKHTILIVLVFGAVAWLLVPRQTRGPEEMVPQHEVLFRYAQSAVGAHTPPNSQFAQPGEPGNGWTPKGQDRLELFGTFLPPEAEEPQTWRVSMARTGPSWVVVSIELADQLLP